MQMETVTISKERFDYLRSEEIMLDVLFYLGFANWEVYPHVVKKCKEIEEYKL